MRRADCSSFTCAAPEERQQLLHKKPMGALAQRQDGAAVCISNAQQIEPAVRQLVTDTALRGQFAAAQRCLAAHHNTQKVKKSLYSDLCLLAKNTGGFA